MADEHPGSPRQRRVPAPRTAAKPAAVAAHAVPRGLWRCGRGRRDGSVRARDVRAQAERAALRDRRSGRSSRHAARHRRRHGPHPRLGSGPARQPDDRSQPGGTARSSAPDAVGLRARAAAFRVREGADRSEQPRPRAGSPSRPARPSASPGTSAPCLRKAWSGRTSRASCSWPEIPAPFPSGASRRAGRGDPALHVSRTRRRDAVSSDGAREQFGELLTILVNPTLTDVFRECRATRYTHVHLLSPRRPRRRGARFVRTRAARSGRVSPTSSPGERFSSALTTVGDGRIHRPTVITVASCDSGNVGSVVRPGASFAHALHQGGVPLVVASQFPLSIGGFRSAGRDAVPRIAVGRQSAAAAPADPGRAARALHVALARLGEPRRLRSAAAGAWRATRTHPVFPGQAGGRRGAGADRPCGAARPTRAPRDRRPGPLDPALSHAISYLPVDGPYGVECIGLRASARKRLAQAAFALAAQGAPGTSAVGERLLRSARGGVARLRARGSRLCSSTTGGRCSGSPRCIGSLSRSSRFRRCWASPATTVAGKLRSSARRCTAEHRDDRGARLGPREPCGAVAAPAGSPRRRG